MKAAMISCEALMRHLDGIPFPATKEELVAFLQEQAAPSEAVWMVERMPGRDFRFATDVENTVRLAHELRLDEPLQEKEETGSPSRIDTAKTDDARLAQVVHERLRFNRRINAWLIRVRVEGGVVTLEGRVTDVPQGLLAAKIAQGVPGVRWVISNLDVAT